MGGFNVAPTSVDVLFFMNEKLGYDLIASIAKCQPKFFASQHPSTEQIKSSPHISQVHIFFLTT